MTDLPLRKSRQARVGRLALLCDEALTVAQGTIGYKPLTVHYVFPLLESDFLLGLELCIVVILFILQILLQIIFSEFSIILV